MKQAVGKGELESYFTKNNGKNQTSNWTTKVTTSHDMQTFGRCIKQETKEGTRNQESKKHQRGTYTRWFALHLWLHI
jgi:hypothetical protein